MLSSSREGLFASGEQLGWRGSRHRSLTPSGPGLCVCSSVSSGLLIPRVYPLQGSNWTPRGLTRSHPLWQALNSNLSSPDPCVCWNMDSTPELPLLELAVPEEETQYNSRLSSLGSPVFPYLDPMNPVPYHLKCFSSSQRGDYFKTSSSTIIRSRTLVYVFVVYLMTLPFKLQAPCRFL